MKHIETAVTKRIEVSANKDPRYYRVVKLIPLEKGKSIPKGAVIRVGHKGKKASPVSPIPSDSYSVSMRQPDGTFKYSFSCYSPYLITLTTKHLKRVSNS